MNPNVQVAVVHSIKHEWIICKFVIYVLIYEFKQLENLGLMELL